MIYAVMQAKSFRGVVPKIVPGLVPASNSLYPTQSNSILSQLLFQVGLDRCTGGSVYMDIHPVSETR